MTLVHQGRAMPLGDAKLVVKDLLRGFRYLLRHSAGPRTHPRPRGLGQLGDILATGLDATVAGLRGGDRSQSETIGLALGRLARIATPPRGADFEYEFRKASYALAKSILRLRKLDNVLIAEYTLAAAARSPLLAGPFADAGDFCAAVALAIAGAHPVLLVDKDASGSDDPFVRSPSVALGCTIGLVATAWIVKHGTVDARKLLMSAVDIVVPLHERLLGGLEGPHPHATLAALFREYAAFIP
jgi:hypothetical protein